MNLKSSQHAKNIGARFRSARSLVPDLNRKSFCERHEINRYTMQSWENGLHVSKGKNVERFIEALAKEGVACTAEWLIDGIGDPARPFSDLLEAPAITDHSEIPSLDSLQEQIFSDIASNYLNSNIKFVKVRLHDNAMIPKFRAGDWLLGVDISMDPARAHQKLCIIELGEQRHVVRKVFFIKDHFLLTALDEQVPSFSLGLETKIYEIVWHMLEQ